MGRLHANNNACLGFQLSTESGTELEKIPGPNRRQYEGAGAFVEARWIAAAAVAPSVLIANFLSFRRVASSAQQKLSCDLGHARSQSQSRSDSRL